MSRSQIMERIAALQHEIEAVTSPHADVRLAGTPHAALGASTAEMRQRQLALAEHRLLSAEKALRKRLGVPRLFRENPAACTAAWTAILVPFAPLFLHPLRTSGVFEQIVSLVPRVEMAGRY